MSAVTTAPSSSFNQAVGKNFHLVTALDTDIIDQLIGDKCDKVHPVSKTRDGFIADRIGTGEMSHQTWARVNETGEVTAALYTYRTNHTITCEKGLCGNVERILTASPHKLEGDIPSSFIFYSISSFARGEGVRLIASVHDELEESYPSTWGDNLVTASWFYTMVAR